jgi:hypothetical protein
MFSAPKSTVAGDTLREDDPFPVREINSGVAFDPRLIDIESLRCPVACGVNVTCTVQEAPAANAAPQLLVWE